MNEVSITIIKGLSGCGKSTLARAIGRFVRDELGHEVNTYWDDGRYQLLTDIDISSETRLEPLRIRLNVKEGHVE